MALSRLRRRLRRARGRRLASSTSRLDLCGVCGAEFVCPVTWSESGPDGWWLRLRCGECGASREYDSQLDEGMSAINRAADRLSREALAAEADTLGAALRHDLLGADDFR